MIRGQNVVLRAVEPADAVLLYQWENQMELWEVSNTLTPFSRYQIDKYIENSSLDLYESKQLRLMIDLCHNGNVGPETIGMIDLFDFDPYHQRAGVGILIRTEFRKKGLAGDALTTFVHYCFNHLGLHQLYCSIGSENKDSRQLFEREGFRLVGVKKEWVRSSKGYADVCFFQLLNAWVKK